MGNKVVKLYDSMGVGLQYQTELLSMIVSTMNAEVQPYVGWTEEVIERMEMQKDMNSCGIYVTAWAENAMAKGEVVNCIKVGEEKRFRKKIYDSLNEQQVARGCDKKIQKQPKLDKYLHKRTRNRLKLLINECIEPLKSHRVKLFKIMNGEWKEGAMLTFMN